MRYVFSSAQWAPVIIDSTGSLTMAYQHVTSVTSKSGGYELLPLPIWTINLDLNNVIAFMLDEEII